MRRLAKQDREDTYASRRDYQQISESAGTRLQGAEPLSAVSFATTLDPVPVAGVGGFLLTPASARVTLLVNVGGVQHEKRFESGPSWTRIGLGFSVDERREVSIELKFDPAQQFIDVWGLTVGPANFPDGTSSAAPNLDELNVSHLAPETLYLDHEGSPAVGDGLDKATHSASPINLKKCSYCGRQLPVGPGQAGRLSFHKHNAKISGHQNECRACKKWRINNAFNPLRTVDQLNESSIITRERRLLLREPEILQTIKEREGRGLKSIVWDKFGRRCFYCSKPLEVKEVQLDHTRPLAYLWPIDEHATCLCAEHNNQKKDKFPVDFYSPDQLLRLSEITGLSLAELKIRSVCEPQLKRIRNDLVRFAGECDPRAFNAIARKVHEILPDVDLWAELLDADPAVYARVREAEAERPDSVVPREVELELDALLDALED